MAKTEKAAPVNNGPKSLPRLKEKYLKEVAPKLLPKYGNPMRVPKITKVVINMVKPLRMLSFSKPLQKI